MNELKDQEIDRIFQLFQYRNFNNEKVIEELIKIFTFLLGFDESKSIVNKLIET